MQRRFIFLLFALSLGTIAFSQVRERSFLLGVGSQNILDTYLSPLEYTGTVVTFHSATMRPLKWSDGNWRFQQSFWADLGFASSPTDDNDEWDGQIQLDWAWRYNWQVAKDLQLQIGPMIEVGAGFTYSLRGGNNPAQGRFATAVGASSAARYQFKAFKTSFRIDSRLDLPLFGAAFSPNYGQSYYEIFSLGHYDHNIVLTHPGNAPTARLLCTLSLPVGASRLYVGYRGEARQSRLNHLKRHSWTNSFMVGYTYTFQKLRQ